MTPGMQQFYDIKKDYEDCILFFRMGDFYEMFDEDANIAHRVLGITVTSRNKNAQEPIPLAGIPFHAKEKYLPILVSAGYKVAIAEQVSDPKLKGIVKREVVRVVTPSTLSLEGEGYERGNLPNYIVSISCENEKYGLSFLDLSEGKWKTSQFENFEKLKGEIYKISPKEVILDKDLFNNTEIKDILSKKYSLNIYYFESNSNSKELLQNHFGVKNLSGFGLDDKPLAIKASSILLEYLKLNQKSDLKFLNSISYETFSKYLEIDESTIRNLDLIYNFATNSNIVGTLFGVLNKTKTSSGSRFLREQILKPLKDRVEIEKRQNFIEEFYNDKILLDKVREKLKMVSDIDSILNRLSLNRANPRDLLNLKRSLQMLVYVCEIIEEDGSEKLKKILK